MQADKAPEAVWTRPDPGHRLGYRGIADDITAKIRSGALQPATRLPTYMTLADEVYSVTLGTVSAAMRLLQQRGLVENIGGRALFVVGTPPEPDFQKG